MIEQNEQNKNAMGGTELMGHRIASLDPDLLKHFQIIHSRPRELDPEKKTVLVLHDLPQDPEVAHLANGGYQKYDKLVFVSYWQQAMYNAYLGVPYSAGVVLRNAVEPIKPHKKPDETVNLIYFSTPHRGLDILYPVFEAIYQDYPETRLKVFSSFDLYGWPERDEQFKDLFDKLNKHPGIEYSKSVSNDVIREHLQQSHIFAYPSTWTETSCLCLMEAMAANLICVHSSLGALPETSLGLTEMYSYSEDPQQHAQTFYNKLKEAVEYQIETHETNKKNAWGSLPHLSANHANMLHNWWARKEEWEHLLRSMING